MRAPVGFSHPPADARRAPERDPVRYPGAIHELAASLAAPGPGHAAFRRARHARSRSPDRERLPRTSCLRIYPSEMARSSWKTIPIRSEEHTSELQSLAYLVCRLLLEKKKIQ